MRTLFLLAVLLPTLARPAAVNTDEATVLADPADYSFGREITFTASVDSKEAVRSARVVLQTADLQQSYLAADISGGGENLLSARRNLELEPLFPFSSVDYWWEVELATGEKILSTRQSLQYVDNRFDWQSFGKGPATVWWIEGDSEQARNAADLLLLSLGTESADLESPIPSAIQVYLYPRQTDFYFGLGPLANGWEGGLTDPDSGIVLLAAAPGAEGRKSLSTLIPHEVAHLLLGMRWKTAYGNLPLWLVEGIAAGYEMEPRQDADQALQDAAKGGTLLPLATLCRSFPTEEKSALLAYSESKSFVAFLKEVYGLAAIRQALGIYAGGADCVNGLIVPTGKTLTDLDEAWRDRLNGAPNGGIPAWAAVLAALLLLGTMLAVGGIARRRKRIPPPERKRT